MTKSYDLAIIGSGPGGYIAALYASRHKLKVCVIEKDLLGGTCLNRGCIPTKVMLNSVRILSEIKESSQHGVDVDSYKVNFPKIVARKDEVVQRLRTGIETLFRANKIDLVKAQASFADESTLKVDGKEGITAKSVIIAAGSRPAEIPGIRIDEENILSSDGALKLKGMPKSILIVGGGVIGVEFATIFNAFGAKVAIAEALPQIVATQSRECSKKLELILKKRGVEVLTSTKAAPESMPDYEKVLVAVGRRSNIEGLGLEAAGIKLKAGRIDTDSFLRTSRSNIYAIGDCVDGPLLAHKASYDGILACDNILGKARRADYSNVPSCIYTEPEIASVGLSEEEAKAKFPDCRVAKFPYLASGKAYIMAKPEGFIKMVGTPEGEILGVEIFGEGACDLIAEAVLARMFKINIKDWACAVHGHPTLSEVVQEAAHVFCGTAIHSA